MAYDVILFDLDGTVLDSLDGIMHALEVCFAHAGLPPVTREQFLPFVGPPIIDTLQQHFGLSLAEAQAAMEAYHSYYRVDGWKECVLYDGVKALFAALCAKGKRLGLATNKPRHYALDILKDKGVDQYFAYIGGADVAKGITNKQKVVEDCLRQLQVTAKEAVMIGDRKFDVEGAKGAGVATIGVTYGYGSRKELLEAGAVAVVDWPKEVLKLI